jgi:hypothetical protein
MILIMMPVVERASCKSHFLCHSGESRNPELLENPGFRVALRLPGMTTSLFLRSFASSSKDNRKVMNLPTGGEIPCL